MPRTGTDYLDRLRDGRAVFIDGERVEDVTAHPAFRQSTRSVARLYDIADCANDPHFRARGSVQEVADPLIGRTLHPGPAIRLDGDAPEDVVAWPGPAAGAHTEYVLHELLGSSG